MIKSNRGKERKLFFVPKLKVKQKKSLVVTNETKSNEQEQDAHTWLFDKLSQGIFFTKNK